MGVQNLQREDALPVRCRVTIVLPGVRNVKVVVGRKGTRVRRAGNAWTIELAALQERAVIECAYGRRADRGAASLGQAGA